MSKLLTTRDAAALLAMREAHLRKLVRAGLIPYVRINSRVLRFNEDSLRKWVGARTVNP